MFSRFCTEAIVLTSEKTKLQQLLKYALFIYVQGNINQSPFCTYEYFTKKEPSTKRTTETVHRTVKSDPSHMCPILMRLVRQLWAEMRHPSVLVDNKSWQQTNVWQTTIKMLKAEIYVNIAKLKLLFSYLITSSQEKRKDIWHFILWHIENS